MDPCSESHLHCPKKPDSNRHFFTNRSTAAQARTAHPTDLQLCAWRLGGRHLPVHVSISLPNQQKLGVPSPPARSVIDTVSMGHAHRGQSDRRIHVLQTSVAICAAQVVGDIARMNQVFFEEVVYSRGKDEGVGSPCGVSNLCNAVSRICEHIAKTGKGLTLCPSPACLRPGSIILNLKRHTRILSNGAGVRANRGCMSNCRPRREQLRGKTQEPFLAWRTN